MRRLYLSVKDKKIAGVCGGIAETYNLDPSLIRLGLVLLCVLTWVLPVIVTYIVAWIIIPEKPQE